MAAAAAHRKSLGQFFTKAEELQSFVFEAVKYKGAPLLEPSFGAGHLLAKFKEYDPSYPMTCFEIDATIPPVVAFNEHQTVRYEDFVAVAATLPKFRTIIGNPPYVKQKGKANLYIRFIDLCFELLAHDGEMIFIIPSDFIKLTSAAALITRMAAAGRFTDFFFPNNERMFEDAAIDVLVFRYQRGDVGNGCILNGSPSQYRVVSGILTFPTSVASASTAASPLSDTFDAYVGLVSGKDDVYRNSEVANIDVLVDLGRTERFLFPEMFPTGSAAADAHLLANKDALLSRRIKKFSETNWWSWGAPRNLAAIRARWGAPCIYVRNMTRQRQVAAVGSVAYFGGTLICLVPKDPAMSATELQTFADALNSETFQKDYMYAGRFKIGHKQLCTALIG
jgi:adenine-specific DNA-methyltransferase